MNFTFSPAESFYTLNTLCVGLLVVLAATLKIGEASRAAAASAAGAWDRGIPYPAGGQPGYRAQLHWRLLFERWCNPCAAGPATGRVASGRPLRAASLVCAGRHARHLDPDSGPGEYPLPKGELVLFRDYTQSGCGAAQSATGPFDCPADQKVYLDLGFWDQLKQYGASGEFAQAYVIAHEIGHHVQNVLGIERKVRAMQQQNPRARNQLSVAMELQADCFAGVWARSTADRKILEQGDVPAALQAAAAVGDDRIQKMARGYVTPDSFTHGLSQQRVGWFNRGLNSGQVSACNTFSAEQSP